MSDVWHQLLSDLLYLYPVPHMEQPRQEAITVMFEYYICNNVSNSAHTSSPFSSHKATCLDFSCWLLWRIIWRQVPAWQCCPVIMNYNDSRHNLETSPLYLNLSHFQWCGNTDNAHMLSSFIKTEFDEYEQGYLK